MNPEVFCRALIAIEPNQSISIKRFQEACGISSRSVSRNVLGLLVSNGIGRVLDGVVTFSSADRLNAALLILQNSTCDIESVSKQLSWKDFEGLASEVLRSFGYDTRTNVRFVKPRMEIDVVGISLGLGIVIDCKHWNRNSISSISEHSRRQTARAKRLVSQEKKLQRGVPVILTLYSDSVHFVEGVPIVPILQFRSFIMDFQAYLQEIRIIEKN
jgi:hypothetical protein